MDKFLIGKIVNSHGLKGEMKVYSYADYLEKFDEYGYILIEGEEKRRKIKGVKYHKNMVILRLEGINHIDDIQKIKGKNLFVFRDDLEPLEDDEFYVVDIIGAEVFDVEKGFLGNVADYLTHTAQELIVIKDENGKEIFIPNVSEFVKKIDIEGKRITVKSIEGLI